MSRPVLQPGSSSVVAPDYWWFAARASLLEAGLSRWLGSPARVLDVGSADGPSAAWMRGPHQHVAIDLDPRGLVSGAGVVASALSLPFTDGCFDVVAAFVVIGACAAVAGVASGRAVSVITIGAQAWRRSIFAASISIVTYGLVLLAVRRAPVGYVAALRESSVLIASLVGWRMLGERSGRTRSVAAGVILVGLVLLVAAR